MKKYPYSLLRPIMTAMPTGLGFWNFSDGECSCATTGLHSRFFWKPIPRIIQ